MTINMPLSATLAALATFLFVVASPEKHKTVSRTVFLAIFFIFLLATTAHFVADFFTNRGIDESVVFHLVYGFKGAGFSEYSTLIILTTLALLFSIALLFVINKAAQHGTRSSSLIYLSLVTLLFSLVTHPVSSLLHRQMADLKFSEKFEDYYRQPVVDKNPTVNLKNLVFIYAEGLESTWLDEELFPSVTPNLQALRKQSVDFSNISQVPYTSWTIGGIVASQCGIPLVVDSHGNGMAGTDKFLPGAVCMGDLLKEKGYKSEFYGGADLEFAGKGNFFKTHGFDLVNGRDELTELIKPEHTTGWGIYDDDLLELAFNRFLELSAGTDPFALFTLTLDTHHPKGMPSMTCDKPGLVPKDSKTPMHFAVSCSDYLISEFINKVRQSSYAEQTLLVLVSDHLAIKNAASSYLDKAERKELFMIIPGWEDKPMQIDISGSILDVGATTMAFLGMETSIGFGRNLLKENTVFDDSGKTGDLFSFWSNHFTEFWEFPSLKNGILSIPERGELKIGNQTIRTPVLIQFDKNLDTHLVFDNFAEKQIAILDATYRRLKMGTPFIYAAECGKFNKARHSKRSTETCLLLGKKGDQHNRLIYLQDSPRVSKEEFEKVIN